MDNIEKSSLIKFFDSYKQWIIGILLLVLLLFIQPWNYISDFNLKGSKKKEKEEAIYLERLDSISNHFFQIIDIQVERSKETNTKQENINKDMEHYIKNIDKKTDEKINNSNNLPIDDSVIFLANWLSKKDSLQR